MRTSQHESKHFTYKFYHMCNIIRCLNWLKQTLFLLTCENQLPTHHLLPPNFFFPKSKMPQKLLLCAIFYMCYYYLKDQFLKNISFFSVNYLKYLNLHRQRGDKQTLCVKIQETCYIIINWCQILNNFLCVSCYRVFKKGLGMFFFFYI